jgi:Predicted membrane protein
MNPAGVASTSDPERRPLAMTVVGLVMVVGGLAFTAVLAFSPMEGGLAILGLIPPLVVGGLMVLAGILALRRGTHAAFVLMTLDLVGLAIASYLSSVELQGQLPQCGVLHGCQEVALSQYARVAGIPVAVFGVVLSLTLLVLAYAWWRNGSNVLLGAHYFLSLLGTVFEGWFTYAELFLIGAVCIWCAAYGISLVLRFVVALIVWLHRPRGEEPEAVAG